MATKDKDLTIKLEVIFNETKFIRDLYAKTILLLCKYKNIKESEATAIMEEARDSLNIGEYTNVHELIKDRS